MLSYKYQIIYADPPWAEYGGGKIKRGADKHYPLMKTEDIIKLPVLQLSDNNAHLYLWVTNNKLPDGLQVMKAWGFCYKTCLGYRTPILTEDGWRTIGDICYLKYSGKVACIFNGLPTFRNIINWHINKGNGRRSRLLEFKYNYKHLFGKKHHIKRGIKPIVVTEDHLILTEYGWKKSHHIKIMNAFALEK